MRHKGPAPVRLVGWRGRGRLRDRCRSSRPSSRVMSRTKLPSCSAVGINWQNKEGRRGRQATTFRRKCNKLHQLGFTTAEECTGGVQRTFPGPATDTAVTFQYVHGFCVIISFAEIAIKARFRGTPRCSKHSGLRSVSDSSVRVSASPTRLYGLPPTYIEHTKNTFTV